MLASYWFVFDIELTTGKDVADTVEMTINTLEFEIHRIDKTAESFEMIDNTIERLPLWVNTTRQHHHATEKYLMKENHSIIFLL